MRAQTTHLLRVAQADDSLPEAMRLDYVQRVAVAMLEEWVEH
jgi:hypothetical protein